MGLLQLQTKRGISLDVPQDEVIKAIGACQWWLKGKWLKDKKKKHPIQKLFQSSDWSSDVELFLIGSSILELRKHGTDKKAFLDKRKEFLGEQRGNQVGYLFELLTALLFSMGGNKVELLPASAAGYDLDVKTPDDISIQVSCKVCQPSNEYSKIITYAEQERDKFFAAYKKLGVHGVNCVIERVKSNGSSTTPFLQYHQYKSMIGKSLFQPYMVQSENREMMGIFSKSPLPSNAFSFSRKYPSYSFVLSSPINTEHELKRLHSQIDKANKGFKKVSDNKKLNLTVIRLPHYLSVKMAKGKIEKEFNKGRFTNTSAVIGIQTHIVGDENGESVKINTAFQMIINPSAIVPWPIGKGALKMVQPLGSITTETPAFQIAGQKINNECYVYSDMNESIVVPPGTSIGSSNIPGLNQIFEYKGMDLAINAFKIPSEFKFL
ncbi:hypothetical protein BpOF4_06515 [Alkalihalophilus pseudofirmus OF4]|uniref:Uncharacterized protein n=1 Tax=Alkalihalophilus pseudofirmus (strain ATCC BAA-2126 / JCM 17055 / OF4) TaxID=398511 RepID=D3G086_ALKPO|nr:hypothetical protein [Alkalihalophilus pseudofirmus]ADC49361.1 hypothetical protein BpOF4_06515 [Alkalihalophilus pseudofirmus OF4]